MESIDAAQTFDATAEQMKRTGSFNLPCSADTAFPLFSPEGERLWISEWDPRPVFPDTIEFQRDAVFREGPAGDEAVWTIVDVDWQSHRAEYVRIAHESHAARVVVKIDSVEGERCRVDVSYTITIFGSDTRSLRPAFSESGYAAKMRNWQRWISDYLTNCASR